MSPKLLVIIALVLLWGVFIGTLLTNASAVVTGFAGLAAGVITGTAFPSRRQILRETK